MSPIAFPDALTEEEAAELKAHHLACRQLVRGCQDAIFRLRAEAGANAESEAVSHRATEIMEGILNSWCETLSVLRSALGLDSSHEQIHSPPFSGKRELAAEDSRRMIARFARSVFSPAQEREHASS